MVNVIDLPCASNQDSPRKHTFEENWKLLLNMTIGLHGLLSNGVRKGILIFALSSLVSLFFS